VAGWLNLSEEVNMIFCNARRPFALLAIALVVFFTAVAVRPAAAADTPPKVSAKDLAAEFVKDAAAAAKKYGDAMNSKEVIVEGVVAEVVAGTYGNIARLEGEGKVVVSILMRKEDEASVKKGDKVTFKGKCRGLFKKENLVDINGGILQKEKDK
jgi:tRNA_anti-like